MEKISFAKPGGFTAELHARIEAYFVQTVPARTFGNWTFKEKITIPKTGDWRLHLSAAIILCGLVGFSLLMLFSGSPPIVLICACILGYEVIPDIGFVIMHGASHGSFSKHPWVNKLLAYSGNLVGVMSEYWHYKHDMLHHPFTNILVADDDVDLYPLVRVSCDQPLLWYHKYQHLYVWPLYFIYKPYWVLVLDSIRFCKGAVGIKKLPDKGRRKRIVSFIFTKIGYFILPVALCVSHGWRLGLGAFFVQEGLSGFRLTTVFQCAHLVDDVPVKTAQEVSHDDLDFCSHQVVTTANFAPHNKFLGWRIGGLNRQIEHHLFPKISHVHYPKLSLIVKSVCERHGIAYRELPTLRQGLISHWRYLRRLGCA